MPRPEITYHPGSGKYAESWSVAQVAIEQGADALYVKFQEGSVNEHGWNGIGVEELLLVCEARLQLFQAGEFRSRESALALTHIQDAIHWLDHRTRVRQREGVEGQDKNHSDSTLVPTPVSDVPAPDVFREV